MYMYALGSIILVAISVDERTMMSVLSYNYSHILTGKVLLGQDFDVLYIEGF